VLGSTAVVSALLRVPEATGQAKQRVGEDLGMLGTARPDLMCWTGREEQPQVRGSLFVEAEPVGDRGRLPTAGDPQLGQDP
jgi:hypothetical protein